MMISSRDDDDVVYVSPAKEVNAGLWLLFTGASVFLGLRIWCKYTRRNGLWYDDYMLVLSWLVLMITDIIISCEYANGYVSGNWNDYMHILINVSSDGTLVGQAWSKTALGITLLRMSNKKQAWLLWFCIGTMNAYMIVKCFLQWAKYCGKSEYQSWYRFQGPCVDYNFEQNFKVGGNTYNIIMDFVFAAFPWWITWSLEMRRVEKIVLCATMSLGMIIAIISAVRTTWKDRPIMHVHDSLYMWRDGMSNIWYSAEVAGTIIVQCIPILRPFLREKITTMSSNAQRSTSKNRGSATWAGTLEEGKPEPSLSHTNSLRNTKSQAQTEIIPMHPITEKPQLEKIATGSGGSFSESLFGRADMDCETPILPTGPLSAGSWSGSERTGGEHSAREGSWIDLDENGLSPPPMRTTWRG